MSNAKEDFCKIQVKFATTPAKRPKISNLQGVFFPTSSRAPLSASDPETYVVCYS